VSLIFGLQRLLKFPEFFVELVPNARNIGPFETDFSGALGNSHSALKGRENTGIPIEFLANWTEGTTGFLGFGLFFGSLNLVPVADDFGGVADLNVPEDMGVAANQFGVDARCDIPEVKLSGFLGDLGLEDHLEQQVAELLDDRLGLALAQGIDGFVGFFKDVGNEALGSLGEVPGAALGGVAQLGDRILAKPVPFGLNWGEPLKN
jgi:hypothetical protein